MFYHLDKTLVKIIKFTHIHFKTQNLIFLRRNVKKSKYYFIVKWNKLSKTIPNKYINSMLSFLLNIEAYNYKHNLLHPVLY